MDQSVNKSVITVPCIDYAIWHLFDLLTDAETCHLEPFHD